MIILMHLFRLVVDLMTFRGILVYRIQKEIVLSLCLLWNDICLGFGFLVESFMLPFLLGTFSFCRLFVRLVGLLRLELLLFLGQISIAALVWLLQKCLTACGERDLASL